MSKKKSSAGKFAIGAAVGAVVGVVAGLLTAPKSGKETRADVKRKAGEAKDFAVDKAGDVKDFATGKASEAKKMFKKDKKSEPVASKKPSEE
ncbi:YtxH domain-containing protein [Candidatus Saccharibacteria bacterium]|nr:YtxH domain-containing protein [Candidatus Saccharibacteria bacterium]